MYNEKQYDIDKVDRKLSRQGRNDVKQHSKQSPNDDRYLKTVMLTTPRELINTFNEISGYNIV